MEEKKETPTELTELQQKTVSRRLDALRADFPIKLLHVLMEDGSEWKWGAAQEAAPHGDPVDVIVKRLDVLGLGQADLSDMLGSRARASDVLGRRRNELTLEQVRILSKRLGVSADLLIAPFVVDGNHPVLPNRTRRIIPGYKRGTLKRLVKPWLELAMSAPGEKLKLRPSDFEGMAFDRVLGSLSAAGINECGRGSLRVWQEADEIEGKIAYAVFIGRVPDTPAETTVPDGKIEDRASGLH